MGTMVVKDLKPSVKCRVEDASKPKCKPKERQAAPKQASGFIQRCFKQLDMGKVLSEFQAEISVSLSLVPSEVAIKTRLTVVGK